MTNKPRPSLIPAEALLEVAKVFEHGAEKYDGEEMAAAYRTDGRSKLTHFDAAQRHALRWQLHWAPTTERAPNDADSGLSHAAHAAARWLIILALELSGPREARVKYPFNPADDLCTEGRGKPEEDSK